MKKNGFTLIEILTVIAIISILAAILIPVAGNARKTAMKRRAETEMNSIKVAAMQFYDDHKYMPWPAEVISGENIYVGPDKWTTGGADQSLVMNMLAGSNVMTKLYLQIPEKSQGPGPMLVFMDPWGQPYQIGMDRNMDGAVTVVGTGVLAWDNRTIMERVLVVSPGPPDDDEPLKTFDLP